MKNGKILILLLLSGCLGSQTQNLFPSYKKVTGQKTQDLTNLETDFFSKPITSKVITTTSPLDLLPQTSNVMEGAGEKIYNKVLNPTPITAIGDIFGGIGGGGTSGLGPIKPPTPPLFDLVQSPPGLDAILPSPKTPPNQLSPTYPQKPPQSFR